MQTFEAKSLTKVSVSIEKVLVAVDLSAHSEETASYAAGLARCFGASLTVVHVYEPVPLCEYASETTYTVLEDERDRLQKLLDELALRV
jgi:nucleotide-binding universal stress UspA family protein